MVSSIAARLRNILRKSESPPEINQDEAVADIAHVEPIPLALRIQSLIDNLPLPHNVRATDPEFLQDGEPLPSVNIQDSKLIRILRNVTIMNGSRNIDDGHPSVWSILEGLGTPRDEQVHAGNPDPQHYDVNAPDMISDSGVMVYSPLLPAGDSLVELADSEVILEEEETNEPVPGPESPPPIPGWQWANVLPTFSWFAQPPSPPPLLDDNDQPLSPRTRERRLRAHATRIWIPSKDKLSIQCMWWGYRMFLPPPVLDILNDRQLEAAKRTAMITTALSWFFNNLPIDAFPLPLRPTLLLIQHIAPCLGYIGTFISWSWSTIASYDQGYGVILSATWLLPIALIPGTWFERDWPISPAPPQSPPLPPDMIPQIIPSSPLPGFYSPVPGIPPTPLSQSLTPVIAPQSITSPAQIPTALDFRSQTRPTGVSSPFLDSAFSTPMSSPAMSFVTAPSSPLPLSPPLVPTSPAGFVMKSPIICTRRILKSKSNLTHCSLRSPRPGPSPLSQLPSQLEPDADIVAYPSPTSTNSIAPIPTSDFSFGVASPLIPRPMDMYPSPPAHPDDLRLLQSPIWECSPLPPEHERHPALPPEMEVQEPPGVAKKRTKGRGVMNR